MIEGPNNRPVEGSNSSQGQRPEGISEKVFRSSKEITNAAGKQFERAKKTNDLEGKYSLEGRVKKGEKDPKVREAFKDHIAG